MTAKVPLKLRNKQAEKSIYKRGQAKTLRKDSKKNEKPAINPTIVGLLLFIVLGGAVISLLQVLFASFLQSGPDIDELISEPVQFNPTVSYDTEHIPTEIPIDTAPGIIETGDIENEVEVEE